MPMEETTLLMKFLPEVAELLPVNQKGVVRLPELVGVPFTARVKHIVDHPHFQRLRNVRQLSLSYLVYPGAVHTRFEHSLGVFETTLRYLRALFTDTQASENLQAVTIGDVESLLLAALLHDIGHYPFAHLLEDLYGEIEEHVDLVRPFLTGDIVSLYPALQLPEEVNPLGDIIAADWPNASFDDICYFVSGVVAGDPPAHKRLLRSVLDGSVDSDKMDYLYRDSIHCGVPYGRFIDRDRFFLSLTVSNERPDTLALHEKGRICVELFAYARSAMFSEVYWHHAARSVTAMINRAFSDIITNDASLTKNALMNLVFTRSDEAVVEWLAERGETPAGELMELIRRRRPYKRLLVINKPSSETLFEMIDAIKFSKALDFNRLQTRFIERVNASSAFREIYEPPLRPHDILIDVPPKRSGLSDVPIIREYEKGLNEGEGQVNVWLGIKQDFESWVRKIRVFVHPDIAGAIQQATGEKRPSKELHAALFNLLTQCAWEAMRLS